MAFEEHKPTPLQPPTPVKAEITSIGGRLEFPYDQKGEIHVGYSRPDPVNSRNYDQFQLRWGEDGVKVRKGWLEWYVTRITFEKKYIYDNAGNFLDEVNSLFEQDSIEGVKIHDVELPAGADPDDPWLQQTWHGKTYAVVELNVETGEPVKVTIEGPAEPQLKAIPRLDSDLSRGSGSGGEGVTRFGFFVYLGECLASGVITQEHLGPLQWYLAFIPEAEASTGSSTSTAGSSAGSSASSAGSSASSAGSSAGSSKDTAIVPTPDGYRKWYAMEASEVLFFDFQEFTIGRGENKIEIDPLVLFSCEKDSLRAFVSPDFGHCTAEVKKDSLVLKSRHSAKKRKQRVQVMLKAVRRGFAGVRLAHATFEDFVDNECRLNPRMSRDEVVKALADRGVTE
jgi:hypothetical protein